MQLLNVITARSVWLFDIAELNPRGKALFPDLFEWLKEAYDFQKVPSSLTDVDDTKAFVFSNGQYQAKEEIFVHVELDRKSTRLNSSHVEISYAVFCLKK